MCILFAIGNETDITAFLQERKIGNSFKKHVRTVSHPILLVGMGKAPTHMAHLVPPQVPRPTYA
jgi:hypothetical protein